MKLSHSIRVGLYVNVWLLIMVVGTALLLVRWQYESRRLYVNLEKAVGTGKLLASDHARVLADKRQLATPARIERVAGQALGMKAADAPVTVYLGSP